MPDDARLARIRERAYLLWLDDACPEGMDEELATRPRSGDPGADGEYRGACRPRQWTLATARRR